MASDLSAAFLGKEHVFSAGEAIVWADVRRNKDVSASVIHKQR